MTAPPLAEDATTRRPERTHNPKSAWDSHALHPDVAAIARDMGVTSPRTLRHLQARAGALPPEAADSPALIDHILDRFHATHREELAWLIPMAQKVETVHGDHEEAPLGLTAALIALADDLESHMQKEEQVLFPMIRGGGHPQAALRQG